MVGQNDRNIELRGEAARRVARRVQWYVGARDARWAWRRGEGTRGAQAIAPLMQKLARGTRLLGHLLERDEYGAKPLLPLRKLTTPGEREQVLSLRRARGAASGPTLPWGAGAGV